MTGFPQEPWAARSDRPESAWQEPSLLNPENIRCFLPAANKNLSFTLSVHLSWAPAGRDKAHRPLGAPGSLAPWGPVRVTPSVQWCAEGRHGYRSVSAHTTLGTSREGAPPSRYPVGTPPLTAVLTLTPLRLPPYCLDCKHLLAVREATCTPIHVATDAGVPMNHTNSVSCQDDPQNSENPIVMITVYREEPRPATAK